MQGKKPDENIRRPMQWSADANAGFTAGRPWRAPDPDFSSVNVGAETGDPASLSSHYRALIARKDIDLIDICTPNSSHAEIALAAATYDRAFEIGARIHAPLIESGGEFGVEADDRPRHAKGVARRG